MRPTPTGSTAVKPATTGVGSAKRPDLRKMG